MNIYGSKYSVQIDHILLEFSPRTTQKNLELFIYYHQGLIMQ